MATTAPFCDKCVCMMWEVVTPRLYISSLGNRSKPYLEIFVRIVQVSFEKMVIFK